MADRLQMRLLRVQSRLKAPKGQYNSFGKYSYRSCEDILEAVKPLLVEEGLLLTLTDMPVVVGERFYMRADATVELADEESPEVIKVTGWAREDDVKKGMDGSQITGTASSYARKYALNALFLIDDTKDSDSEESARQQQGQQGARKQQQQSPWQQMLSAFYGKCDARGFDPGETWGMMLRDLGFTELTEYSQKPMVDAAMAWVNRME